MSEIIIFENMDNLFYTIGLDYKINSHRIGAMDWDDDKKNIKRYIYNITLFSEFGSYTFEFGQSIANSDKTPLLEDILSGMTWYDPNSFEEFCNEYGYNTDSRKAYETYEACEAEYSKLQIVFGDYFDQMVEFASEL